MKHTKFCKRCEELFIRPRPNSKICPNCSQTSYRLERLNKRYRIHRKKDGERECICGSEMDFRRINYNWRWVCKKDDRHNKEQHNVP